MIPFLAPALAIASKVPAKVYVYGAIALTILGLAWYGDHQRKNYKAEQTAFKDYKANIVALGRQAERAAEAQKAADLKRKKVSDDENQRSTAALDRELVRLRANNASRSFVPPTPAGSSRPDLACYDRAEFDRALRAFDAGSVGLAGEGTKNTVDLNSARGWAQGR